MSGINIEINELCAIAKQLKKNGCVYQYYEDTQYDGRKITVNNKELLHFANCSYLGLETNNSLIEGAIDAVKRYGVQNSMSRAMLSSPLYKEFEGYLSEIFPGHQIVYPTVTLAHCSALPLLIKEKDAIILDAYAHNSIRMASQLCKANGTFILLSKHNDMEHVKYLIYRLKKEGYRNIWYCADGIYSIHGNHCNVSDLYSLLDKEDNFYAYIDDAHGIGWCGNKGSGYVIGNYGLHDKVVVAVSFNKSFAGAGGGLIVSDKEIAEMLGMTGQTMIFSGPIQPPMLGALIASAKLHLSPELEAYQKELVALITFFREKSSELKIPIITKDISPIQLLGTGNLEITNSIIMKLIDKGFFAMAVGYPAIAEGSEGIRISITRYLLKDDITNFLETLSEILQSENLLI